VSIVAANYPLPIDGLFLTPQIIKSPGRCYLEPGEDETGISSGKYAKKEMTMRKTILTVLGASLVAALTVQAATAAGHHENRRPERATAGEQFRNSNAYAAPAYVAAQPDWSRYGGGMSAPAGH
jgi:hypothetical protein